MNASRYLLRTICSGEHSDLLGSSLARVPLRHLLSSRLVCWSREATGCHTNSPLVAHYLFIRWVMQHGPSIFEWTYSSSLELNSSVADQLAERSWSKQLSLWPKKLWLLEFCFETGKFSESSLRSDSRKMSNRFRCLDAESLQISWRNLQLTLNEFYLTSIKSLFNVTIVV